MVKLKDYIKEVLASIPRGEYGHVEFDVGVEPDMEVNQNSKNKIKFHLSKAHHGFDIGIKK